MPFGRSTLRTEDLTPSGFYSKKDAERALRDATLTVELVHPHVVKV